MKFTMKTFKVKPKILNGQMFFSGVGDLVNVNSVKTASKRLGKRGYFPLTQLWNSVCSNVDLIVQPGLYLPNRVQEIQEGWTKLPSSFCSIYLWLRWVSVCAAFFSCGARGLSGCSSQAPRAQVQ